MNSLILPRDVRQKPLVPLAFLIFGLFAAYKVAGFILAGDLTSLGYSVLTFLAAGIVVSILKSWRNGLYFFLAWLLLEDLARKFLGNNMAVYLAKDFLVTIVYLAFFLEARRRARTTPPGRFRPPFRIALLTFAWFALLQIFNPASTHIAYGILGVKIYLYYMPLLLVGYSLVESEVEMRKFFQINILLMSVIALLGVAQSVVGPRFLNPSVLPEDIRVGEVYRVAPISGAVVYRPNSVFVTTGRFSNMLILSWFMAFGFSAYLLLRHRGGRSLAFLCVAAISAGCLMCGSRGVFMWSLGCALLGSVAFVWGAPWRQGEALRMVRALQRASIGIAVAIGLLMFTYPDAFLGRIAVYSETLDPRSPVSELAHRAHDYPLANFLAAFDYPRWPYGYGIGTLSLGGQYIARFFHTKPAVGGVESGFGSIVVELGIVGLVLWLIMAASILVCAWKVVRNLKGSPWFPVAFVIFLYAAMLLLPMTFASLNSYQDFILNAYLWLLLGILFRLPDLALSAQYNPETEQTSPGARF